MSNPLTPSPAITPAPAAPVDYAKRARNFAAMLNLPARMKPGTMLTLADYPDEETLTFLAPGATLEHHRSLIHAVRDELQGRGATVEFLTLHLQDYYSWLSRFNFTDSPLQRAEFVSWCAQPEPKPSPVDHNASASLCQN
jgi:hypothetical protein